MNDYGGGCRRRGADVDLLSRVIIWGCSSFGRGISGGVVRNVKMKPRSDARGKHTNRIDAWPITQHNTDNQRRKCVKQSARTFVRGYFVGEYLMNESDV